MRRDGLRTVVCSYCTRKTVIDEPSFRGVCSHCHRKLPESDWSEKRLTGGLSSVPTPSNNGPPATDEELIRDLRDALTFSGSVFADGREEDQSITVPTDGSTPSFPQVPEGRITRRIGEFEIIDEIGHGGMGVVYRARQLSLDREVALKVLPGAVYRSGSSLRRFRAEARAVARLHHPNVVPIYAQGELDTHYYYAMALIEGCSLDVAIHQKPGMLSSTSIGHARSGDLAKPDDKNGAPSTDQISGNECGIGASPLAIGHSKLPSSPPLRTPQDFRHVARLMADVADGLVHAHEHGVIHRDIKPQNLLLGTDGRIYITDFGLAMLTDEPHLTVTGDLMGTPAYLSPEQVRGDSRSLDHRTDIYSLGVTLYEVLTSRRPFAGETRAEIMGQICKDQPPPPRRIDHRIPTDLETICLRAIDKVAACRYPSAASMAGDLRRFAEGQPIHSRRLGLVRRGSRLVWRRRGIAAGSLLMVVSLAVAAGYFSSLAASRKKEGDRLIQKAYDQLVYSDYRTPELVKNEIERADKLGVDPNRLDLVRAIAGLGTSQNSTALQHLQGVLAHEPNHTGALYLLSWALWRERDPQKARETFDRAESLGGPHEADEWFFRGLAAHFDRPAIAMESYEKANDLRASDGEFFPQSVLHLARAYNQQMYSARTLDVFEDAQAILSQLIKRKHYGAYPYYLLSITQRLHGEILEARTAPTTAQEQWHTAANSFHSALDSALLGQEVDPDDDRPITAEAECLERLGRFDEAIEARSRAIAAAKEKPKRCEGYHYRWRLHYWMDEWDAALEDIATHAACMPESLFYARVYPLFVHAEVGDIQRALTEARAIAQASPKDITAALWSAACLRFLGHGDEASDLLSRDVGEFDDSTSQASPQSAEWLAALYECSGGSREMQDLLTLADNGKDQPGGVHEPRKLRAEVYFHLAMKALAEGRRSDAISWLTNAHHSFDSELRYTFHAKTLLVKLQTNPDWPPWLPATMVQPPAP